MTEEKIQQEAEFQNCVLEDLIEPAGLTSIEFGVGMVHVASFILAKGIEKWGQNSAIEMLSAIPEALFPILDVCQDFIKCVKELENR